MHVNYVYPLCGISRTLKINSLPVQPRLGQSNWIKSLDPSVMDSKLCFIVQPQMSSPSSNKYFGGGGEVGSGLVYWETG